MAYDKNHYRWLPNPDNLDEEFPWVRASQYIDCIEDLGGLNFWLQKMTAFGIATREDLQVLAASTDPNQNKGWWSIIQQAKDVAGGNKASNLGTAFHSFREAVDKGEDVKIPPAFKPMMESYKAEMSKYGFQAVPELIERNIVHKDLGVAGTFDNIYRLPSGELVIADTKTNKDLKFGALKRAMQMSIYANAPLIWNKAAMKYDPMPEVSKTKGYVIHIPSGGNTCSIVESNLELGWEAVKVAGLVRAQRALKGHEIETVLSSTTSGYEAPEGVSVLDQILSASSISDLESVWKQASSGGQWSDDLTKVASQRKKDLLAPRQKKV